MTRKRASQTRYTLPRNTASIIKDLIHSSTRTIEKKDSVEGRVCPWPWCKINFGTE